MSDHERAHPLSQAKWARGSVIAMSSAVTLDARASRAWVRRYARTTPGVVVLIALAEVSAQLATDYCEVCGLPVATPAAPPAPNACPACGAAIRGRFGEDCGHDSALPAPAVSPKAAVSPPAQWTAIVTADRDYYSRVIARGGPDTVEFPEFFPERRISLHGNTLIGRTNRRQGVEPGIDLGIHPTDRGVSTQHAVLRTRDAGLTVADLGSTNGTSLNDSDDLLANGEEITLTNGDRIHVGAWTTITVARSQESPQ